MSPAPPSAKALTPIQRAIDLAEKRRCGEALPLLNKLVATEKSAELKYRALMATEHCAVYTGDGRATVNVLMALWHEYPKDPEVLYLTAHVFMDIAVRASRELDDAAPESYQLRQLQAESLETQGKWEDAAAIYRNIIEHNPSVPAIHFRLGRALLSQPETPALVEDARRQFLQELAIDPMNASAEFWLGEIARRNAEWDEALPHFTSAVKLDPKLTEAILALGMTFNSAARYAEAIPSLENYIKSVPNDAAGHYQLALAYGHVGRKEDSMREKNVVQQLSDKPAQ